MVFVIREDRRVIIKKIEDYFSEQPSSKGSEPGGGHVASCSDAFTMLDKPLKPNALAKHERASGAMAKSARVSSGSTQFGISPKYR
jgi:hypothetical protein